MPIGKAQKLGKSRRHNIEFYAAIGALLVSENNNMYKVQQIEAKAYENSANIWIGKQTTQ